MEGWLDRSAAIRLCVSLAVLEVAIAAFNAAVIPFESRPTPVAWRTHLEAPAAPARPPETEERPALATAALHYLKHQLDLDRECNFVTWLSATQAAAAAAAAALLVRRTARRPWLLVSLGLLYYSIDESCQIHEWVGVRLSEAGVTFGSLARSYPWVLVLGPLFLAYGAGALAFLHRELAHLPRLRALGWTAILLMAASLPLELLGGLLQGAGPRPPRLEVIGEELCEFLGSTLLLFVLLTLLAGERSAPRQASPAR